MKWIKSHLFLIFFLVIFLISSYWRLGADPLFDWDEAIYAQVGRELKFPFLDLTWNGDNWFEKPPLLPWLVKAGFSITTDPELGARLFMPIFGVITIFYAYKIARLFFNSKSASLVAGSFLFLPLFLSRSRALNCDIVLLASFVATIYYLHRFTLKETRLEFKDFFLSALTAAIGFMAKGLMGGLVWLVWLAFLIIAAPQKIFTKIKSWLLLISLVLLLIAPWHAYMILKHGRHFWHVYFWEQIFARTQQPIEYHFGGRLYYVKFLWENLRFRLIPIGLTAIVSLIDFIKNKRKLFWLLLAWGAIVLGIFTFAKTKLFWYIFPLYPVFALLGVYWGSLVKGRVGVLLVVLMALGIFYHTRKIVGFTLAKLSARNDVARQASHNCQSPLAVLVPFAERQAEAILPDELELSSSFAYGGSPAVEFYYQDRVNFFYNTADFENSWQSNDFDCVMITTEDKNEFNVKGQQIQKTDTWQLLKNNPK